MDYQLLTFLSSDGPRAGIQVEGKIYDAMTACGDPRLASMTTLLADWSAAEPMLERTAAAIGSHPAAALGRVAEARLLAPLPEPGDIYCAGANYDDHGSEMDKLVTGTKLPSLREAGGGPWFFMKNSRDSIVGPGAEVARPQGCQRFDWELELAAVIGRRASRLLPSEAVSAVAGYTVANDLSARDLMKRANLPVAAPFYYDWLAQKCFDGSCPLGPWIVPARQVPDPQKLAMKLWVGEELMQDSNTSHMIFSVAEQVAALSHRVTLHPGDLVLTGTPAGVGMGRGRYLQPGETVRLWIEQIGEFSHQVV